MRTNLFTALLLIATWRSAALAQLPPPAVTGGTCDAIVAEHRFPASPSGGDYAISLVGSAQYSITICSYSFSDGALSAALVAALSGHTAPATATYPFVDTEGNQITLAGSGGTPTIATSGNFTLTATDSLTTSYGPWVYTTYTGTGSIPAGGAQITSVAGSPALTLSATDANSMNHQTDFARWAAFRPISLTTSSTATPISVNIYAGPTGGTNTTQSILLRSLSAAGATITSGSYPKETDVPVATYNNLVVADSAYSLQGTYAFSPSAIQQGTYLLAVSGTNNAANCMVRYNNLLHGTSGTFAANKPCANLSSFYEPEIAPTETCLTIPPRRTLTLPSLSQPRRDACWIRRRRILNRRR